MVKSVCSRYPASHNRAKRTEAAIRDGNRGHRRWGDNMAAGGLGALASLFGRWKQRTSVRPQKVHMYASIG